MDANLNLVIDQVSKDKGIERDILVMAIEESILVAAKRAFGADVVPGILAAFSQLGSVFLEHLDDFITVAKTPRCPTFSNRSVRAVQIEALLDPTGIQTIFRFHTLYIQNINDFPSSLDEPEEMVEIELNLSLPRIKNRKLETSLKAWEAR